MHSFGGPRAFPATVDEVRRLFATYGKVTRVPLLEDRDTGRPRGFGFVKMSHDTQARAAMASLNGTHRDGRRRTSNAARPRDERRGPRRGPRWDAAGSSPRGDAGGLARQGATA